jgi:hypothetical protein
MNCSKCGRPINEHIETVWQKVIGWEKKRDAGGTNHIALREPQPEVMCAGCMQLMLDGLDPGQQSLI